MVLLLGGSGNLGLAFKAIFHNHAVKHLAPSSKELDITQELSVRNYISKLAPRLIINCVAQTNVDWCEDHPEEANLVNGKAVGFVALAAKKCKARLIHISTDYVFDGKKALPYTEDDEPNPVQAYGRSKLLGERLALDNQALVARVQWVLGTEKNNFVRWVVDSLVQQKEVRLSTLQKGSPCSSAYLSSMIFFFSLFNEAKGIYHITHDDYVSRYDCGIYLANRLKLSSSVVVPAQDVNFGKAQRPINTMLSNAKIRKLFSMTDPDPWSDDLQLYLASQYRSMI